MIVEPDVTSQLLAELGVAVELDAVHEVSFQGVEKRFDVGVVAQCPVVHALHEVSRRQARAKRPTSIFTATIAVKNDARAARSLVHRVPQRRLCQPDITMAAQAPPEQSARAPIQNDGQIAPLTRHPHVRDVPTHT